MTERKYDIIIHGATGFVGNLCAHYLFKNYPHLKWAIAGRNVVKMQQWKEAAQANCDVIHVELTDLDAISRMTYETRVLVNCVGPYSLYATPIVKSCVTTATHYCDLTAEIFWIKEIIENFHTQAKEANIKIVHSAGFDSIPSDLGVLYCVSNVQRPLKKIESFFHASGGVSGGTLASMREVAEKGSHLRQDPFCLTPKHTVSEEQRKAIQFVRSVGAKIGDTSYVSGPFIMADANTAIVNRSAGLAKENHQAYSENFTYQEYGSYKNAPTAYGMTALGFVGTNIMKTPLNNLVVKLKKPGEGPKDLTKGGFKATFLCTDEADEAHKFFVRGKGDPGYLQTSMMLIETAVGLLHDSSGRGGVLTPASALGNSLIKRLSVRGITFARIN